MMCLDVAFFEFILLQFSSTVWICDLSFFLSLGKFLTIMSFKCCFFPIIFFFPFCGSNIFGKNSDAGRDLGQEEKGTTEDEMAGWHHWLDGQEFGWTPGVGDGQGGLVCCDSWGRKELDTTERLNWTELNILNLKLCILYYLTNTFSYF